MIRRRTGMGLMALWAAFIWCIASGGCQTASNSNQNEAESAADEREDFIPITDQQPLPKGDVRHLANCAEIPFDEGVRGPWEDYSSLELVTEATAQHHTTDRVFEVGESIELDATIAYDEGTLAGEWVRLFVSTCQGWQQIGVRPTDESGRVSFRLDQRIPAGVYGFVFQVVGDTTHAGGQLWIVSRQTDMVVFDIDGAAFEDVSGNPTLVDGAPQLSQWYGARGRLVAYVNRIDDEGHRGAGGHRWRQRLRQQRFAVGPVVDIEAPSADDGGAMPVRESEQGRWGRAGDSPTTGLPLPNSIDRLYAASSTEASVLKAAGMKANQIRLRDDYIIRTDDRFDDRGWRPLLKDLRDGEQSTKNDIR